MDEAIPKRICNLTQRKTLRPAENDLPDPLMPTMWLSQRTAASLLALWLAGIVLLILPVRITGQESRAERAKIERFEKFQAAIQVDRQAFSRELETIAQYCDENQLPIEAEEIRQLAKPLSSNVVQGKNLPRQVQLPIPESLPEVEKKWRQNLRTLQLDYAANLFTKAKLARDTGRISLAYDLVREVARHDPDHKFARKLLGYVRYEDEWVTVFAEKMLKQKYVLTKKYGWLKAEQKDRYEGGERYYKGQWMSAAKEAELRRDFKNAWIIRTEHYEIHTNHSLERGVELASHLENFYQIFFQTFAGLLTSKANLDALFKGASATGGVTRQYVVHYYRTKQEYINTLRPMFEVPIEGTTGLYLSGNRNQPGHSVAHFFHNTEVSEEDQLATMFHEATHQLFSEGYGSNETVGDNSDFWAVEAIACYMESFKSNGETFSLGDPTYIRFQNAQLRLWGDQRQPPYYMPLQQLCELPRSDFQAHPEVSKNYSEGAGLAHFFMHADDGAFRDAFIEYLSDIYNKNPKIRAQPRSLEVLTETKFPKLDQQYRDYITELKTGQQLRAARK